MSGAELPVGQLPAGRVAARRRSRGQALPLMVVAMIVLIGMTGLIVDGGNAWANSRAVQNGADAAAEAGALALARELAGAARPGGGWDADVLAAINASAAANGIIVRGAYYTDICGIPLKSDGTASLTDDGVYKFDTAQPVGEGLPVDTSTTPDCPSRTVGPVSGVIVLAGRDVDTYFSNVLGLRTIEVTMQATAAAGFLQESCAASQGEGCAMLPIVFPVAQITCGGTGGEVAGNSRPWSADGTTVYKVPLCKNGPGNVGWVDWESGGGVPDVIDSISAPDNPAVPLPSWHQIAQTGDPASIGLEDAIREYDGQTVLVPQFDLTCGPGPNETVDSTDPAINTAPYYGCPAGSLGGNGSKQYYRIPSFVHFRLCDASIPRCLAIGAEHGAYVNGTNDICADTGSPATACLIGMFETVIRTGTIGAGFGGGGGRTSRAIGIQLIK